MNAWSPTVPVSTFAPLGTVPVQSVTVAPPGALHVYAAATAEPCTTLAPSPGASIAISGGGPNRYAAPAPKPGVAPSGCSPPPTATTFPDTPRATPNTSLVTPAGSVSSAVSVPLAHTKPGRSYS